MITADINPNCQRKSLKMAMASLIPQLLSTNRRYWSSGTGFSINSLFYTQLVSFKEENQL